jgi:serine phosphatase RsbU (regulator of sigma subunit)
VLPSYEVGGDWVDYVENRDATWLAVADSAGRGPTAAGLGASALAALRSARRSEATLEQAAAAVHAVVAEMGDEDFFVTAVLARWHAPSSTFQLDQLRPSASAARTRRRSA